MKKNILYYGSEDPLPEKVRLRAGHLDLVYENGFLRYINLGQHEIIRMINHAVRDHNWGTASFKITEENIQTKAKSFTIDYKANINQNDIKFKWNCRITGKEDSSIRFTIEGEALSSFQRNRIGFTILHPVRECAGKAIKITHPDRSSSKATFPELISPHQPFKNIQEMEWELGEIKANLKFVGEVFETEDQRNWIDESYKTYCTPLDLPFPVQVENGQKIKQEISLKLSGQLEDISGTEFAHLISISSTPRKLPKIGICQSSEVKKLNAHEIRTIKNINFDHYQADLFLYDDQWMGKWKEIKNAAKSLNLPVELSLFFNDILSELSGLKEILNNNSIKISIVNLFNKTNHSTQKETLKIVLPELRKLLPKAKIGAGTNAFFTELNRDRTPSEDLDFLVYSINPQVHAFDNDSLCETLNAIPYTIRSTKAFSGDIPVHISPITFKMRWNPNATGERIVDPGQIPDDVDKRQMSLFAASWLIGVFNAIITEEPESVSFFETVGLKGIMQSSRPKFAHQIPVPSNHVYPIFLIFNMLLNNKSAQFYHVHASHTNQFSGLAWGRRKPETLLLANFQIDPISVSLPDQFIHGSVLEINEKIIESLMRKPDFQNLKENVLSGQDIALPPYGIVIVKIHS